MDLQKIQTRLFQTTHPVVIALTALMLLGGMMGLQRWLQRIVENQDRELARLSLNAEQITLAKERYQSMRDLKELDVARFKAGFSGVAKSNKDLFESGLSLQEERRLLEKQLEIMTTTLVINPSLQRIFLMRDGQPLQSYLISYIPLRSFPSQETAVSSSTSPVMTSTMTATASIRLPSVIRIVSKERFAHPERGKSEEVNGRLQYAPPQVGTSVRSNALGEFVMFTNSPLIIHGPPLNPDDHEKFPHICLGLDLEAARKLYRSSFIGTKIILRGVSAIRASSDINATVTPIHEH